MSEFLGSVWWLIVALGLLVTFHEYGHYWVARRCGVRVLRFSVGFGRALWSRRAADGTVYQVAAIPLGGYVKMLDEREGEVREDERAQAFNNKPVQQRIAIVVAGPVFNLVFAVLAFWVMFMVGTPEVRPIVGEVSGIAADAGFRPEDRIVAMDGEPMESWTHAILGLVTRALDRDRVTVEVEQADGATRSFTMDLSRLPDDFSEERTLEAIGITPWRPVMPLEIGTVTEGSAAQAAGLREGDRITRIGETPISNWGQIGAAVQQHGDSPEPLVLEVARNGRRFELEIHPTAQRQGLFGKRWVLGVASEGPDPATRATMDRAYVLLRHGPVESLTAAVAETWRLTRSTVGLLGRMITGSASVRNISGPIGIAQFANDSASAGLSSFLFFLGLISLSLGILNLLPIPLLDGGHLMYYLIEWAKGSPVPEQVQVAGQYVGLAALFGLISLGVFNDILRLVG